MIAKSEEAVAALSASSAKKQTRASPAEATSEAQALQRVNQKCRCKDENNCFLKVSSATLLEIKNQSQAMSSVHRQIFVTGKLDALANRHELRGHHGTVGERAAADQCHVTYIYGVDKQKVCQAVFMYVYSVSARVLRKIQAHLNEGICCSSTAWK